MPRGRPDWVRRLAATCLVPAVALGLAGCGSASDPSPPAGVDGLVIPTPSVDPADFVDGVDNPWFPLEAGSTWTYDLSGAQSGTVTVTVADEVTEVAGVGAMVVETTWPDRGTTDYYAADRAGNVWWLGREGVWQAGVDGARAGLAMAATPRLGDGYRMALLDGVVADRAEVRSVTAEATVPAGSFEGCVDIRTDSPLVPGVQRLQTYAAEVGLVRVVSLEGPNVTLELVSGP